jgi:hypothetical protein
VQAGSVLGTAATGVLRLKDAITSSSRPAAAYLKYMGYGGIGGFAAVGESYDVCCYTALGHPLFAMWLQLQSLTR